MKHSHEFRDPIHTFISVRTDERKVIDSRPFQRLRHIHQLALSYLVYPGATHKRFEHSLGVMDIASRIFDIVTAPENVHHDSVRNIIPDEQARYYWKSVLRMAALCHDVGHLPFSHAAEKELLPKDYDHEQLTKDIIYSGEMEEIWKGMTPPLRSDDIVKLAVGPKKAAPLELNTWETVLAEIIIGDALGADRMDYLLRDSYHAGVAYGTFDRHRLINTLRILPAEYQESDEPALGLEAGGLESSEGLMIARHFMYKQVYLHHIRRVYDIHLKDFLTKWLKGGKFSTDLNKHMNISDVEVLVAIRRAYENKQSSQHVLARRIQCREHFRLFYEAAPSDTQGGKLIPGKVIAEAAEAEFGSDRIRYDHIPPKTAAPIFPVLIFDGKIESSLQRSQVLKRMPEIGVDNVYCDKSILTEAIAWRNLKRNSLLSLE
ncbi:phosphohydrolase [Beijerinckiaceae bacterium]|nr:phosphohydrolase [Beijerinckiaceae bacterium]